MKQKLSIIIGIIFISMIVLNAAGEAGKIAGNVSDAQTGEPLSGVNIVIPELGMGAASDVNGNFTIANIPPGVYELQATMIGYAQHIVKEVRVEIDLTTEINIQMRQEAIEGETIEVIAEKKVIKKDVAGSQKSVSADEIDRLPVSDVGDVLGLKAGVTSGLSIRGSSSQEALFAVDGIALRDERTNEPIMSVPLSATQEISVQTGGLSAQYSNVRSGVVNVVTKEGAKDHYSGTFTVRYSPPESKTFGYSPFDPSSAWLRPFLDPEVCWTGTRSGAWDEYTQRQYQDFGGWNQFSQNLASDDNPDNDLTPAAAQRLFEWQYRKDGNIDLPDRTYDFGFGGPVPVVSEKLGDLRFFLSHRNKQTMYPIELTTDGWTDHNTMLKVTSDINESTKLTLQGIYGEIDATTASRGGGTDYFNSTWEVADAINMSGFTIPWRLYTNTYWAPTTKYYNIISAKLNHVINSGTYYTIQAKRISKEYHTTHGAYRDTTTKYDIFPGEAEYLVNEAPFGFWPRPVNSIDGGIIMGGAVSTARDFSKFDTYELKFDYKNQLTFRHQLRTGLKIHYDDFNIKFGSQNEFLPAGNYMTEFQRNPYRITGYVEDKIEYEGFITTVGLIPQLIVFNGKWYNYDDYEKGFLSQNYDEEMQDEYLTKEVDPKFYLSPRVAISHPITEDSKLFFNYGHYREMPQAEDKYRILRDNLNKLSYIGDPTLPLTRTISYEVGFDQSILNTYLLHISAYYKDIDNETAWTDYINIDGKVNYSKLESNHYENIRGFEVELIKNYGDWITGMINYEYRSSSSGYFGVGAQYENPSDQSDYERQNPYRQYWYPATPQAKANIDFHTPSNYGPELAGQRILGGWHFNFVGDWQDGSSITWNPKSIPGLRYNLDMVDYYNLNLKIAKVFDFGRAKIKLFADVYNLLNTKRFSNESFEDIHDYNDYMYSLHIDKSQYDRLGYKGVPGDDKFGEYRDYDVKFQPMEYTSDYETVSDPSGRAIYYDGTKEDYFQYQDGEWSEVEDSRIDKILEDKAYIDMPNQRFFTFLSPRDVFVGLTVSFDLR